MSKLCERCHKGYDEYKDGEVFCENCGHSLYPFNPTCKCGEPIRFLTTMHLLCIIEQVWAAPSHCSKCGTNLKPILKQSLKEWEGNHPIQTIRSVWNNTAMIRFVLLFTLLFGGMAYILGMALRA